MKAPRRRNGKPQLRNISRSLEEAPAPQQVLGRAPSVKAMKVLGLPVPSEAHVIGHPTLQSDLPRRDPHSDLQRTPPSPPSLSPLPPTLPSTPSTDFQNILVEDEEGSEEEDSSSSDDELEIGLGRRDEKRSENTSSLPQQRRRLSLESPHKLRGLNIDEEFLGLVMTLVGRFPSPPLESDLQNEQKETAGAAVAGRRAGGKGWSQTKSKSFKTARASKGLENHAEETIVRSTSIRKSAGEDTFEL